MTKDYWVTVPRGVWTVIDPVDVIAALRDEESIWELDKKTKRIYIKGPVHKGLIVELTKIQEYLDSQDWDTFLKDLANFIPEIVASVV